MVLKTAGALPIMTYTVRLRPKAVPFFGLQVFKRLGISLFEVHKKVRKSVISAKGPKKANRRILWQ